MLQPSGPLPKRHSWFWVALPASARTVRVLGDPDLAGAVAACGYELVDLSPADAVLVGGLPKDQAGRVKVQSGEALGVVVDAAATPNSRPGWRRALELLLSPLRWLTARRYTRKVISELAVSTPTEDILMSDRSRTIYGLGRGLLRRGLPPVGVIVRSTEQPSVLEAAIAEAGQMLGRDFRVRELTVVESAKLIAELEDKQGTGYILRMAGGPSADYLERSLSARAAISGERAPRALREHVVKPLLDGRVGRARYYLEPKVGGRHPRRLNPELWDDCMTFLIELHCFSQSEPVGADAIAAQLAPCIDVLSEVVGGSAEGDLHRLGSELSDRLTGIRLGWGHGDFWPYNFFVKDHRLSSVIDWDTASLESFPLHDLWDLITMITERRGRGRGPGERCVSVLWPSLEGGDDLRVVSYCRAVGLPTTGDTLVALSLAYWLTRTARDIRDVPPGGRQQRWVQRNIWEPLAVANTL